MRAAEGGASPELLGRYLEAWLLRLQRALSAARPLRRLRRGAPGGGRARLPPRGARLRVRRLRARLRAGAAGRTPGALLASFFRRSPDALGDAVPAARALEAFHRDLIAAHLERDLRAPRVIREIAREALR